MILTIILITLAILLVIAADRLNWSAWFAVVFLVLIVASAALPIIIGVSQAVWTSETLELAPMSDGKYLAAGLYNDTNNASDEAFYWYYRPGDYGVRLRTVAEKYVTVVEDGQHVLVYSKKRAPENIFLW